MQTAPLESTQGFSRENVFLKGCNNSELRVHSQLSSRLFHLLHIIQNSSSGEAEGLQAVKENAWIKDSFNTAMIRPATPSSTNPGRPSSPLVREARWLFPLK